MPISWLFWNHITCLFSLETIGNSQIIIWWLIFEKRPFQFLAGNLNLGHSYLIIFNCITIAWIWKLLSVKSKLSKGHTVSKPWEVSSVWKAPGDDVRLQEEPPKCSKERTENAHAGYYKAYLCQFSFRVSRQTII